MKKLLTLAVAMLFVLPAFAGNVTTAGNTDLELSGSTRIRWDYYNNIYDFRDHNDDPGSVDYCPSDECDDDFSYMPWRANIVLKAMLARNVDVVTNLQAVGFFGNEGDGYDGYIEGPWAGSGPYADSTYQAGSGDSWLGGSNVSIFEGYIHVRNAWDSNWSFKLGRQTMPLGSEFLVGDDDWYDGVSFDGIRTDFSVDLVDLNLFWHKLYEGFWSQTYSDEGDGNFMGAFANWKFSDTLGLETYLYDVNANVNTDFSGSMDYQVYTLGARVFSKEKMANFDWSAELMWQSHNWNDDTGVAAADDVDGSGMALDGWVGYTFDTDKEPRLALGLTYITGDDDDTDTDSDGFWRMFGDSHGKWGTADLLYSSALGYQSWDVSSVGGYGSGTSSGLLVGQLNFAMKATDAVKWGANIVYFQPLEEDFNGYEVNWDVLEIDGWVNYDYSEHFSVNSSISYVDASWEEGPSGSVVDDELDNAWRAYVNFLAKW